MNNRRLKALVESLVLENGLEPPPARIRSSLLRQESPWRAFVKKIQPGQSVVLPTRQVAGLVSVAVDAGFRVQTNRIGNERWTGSDLDLVGHEKGEAVVVHQTRVWFLKDE